MNHPTDIVKMAICGCVCLDVRLAGDLDQAFVVAACAQHSKEHRRGWSRVGQLRDTDVGMALAALNGVSQLIGDGWKYRELRALLGPL